MIEKSRQGKAPKNPWRANRRVACEKTTGGIHGPIDLRSDTLTKPTDPMRRAMAEAPVGDDVYGEDPTALRLQDRVAELLGKEAGLFVPSGSMGNLIALYLQAGRGGEVLAHEHSHIIHFELASGAALAGCQILAVPGDRGILRPETLESRVRGPVYYNARTKLVESRHR